MQTAILKITVVFTALAAAGIIGVHFPPSWPDPNDREHRAEQLTDALNNEPSLTNLQLTEVGAISDDFASCGSNESDQFLFCIIGPASAPPSSEQLETILILMSEAHRSEKTLLIDFGVGLSSYSSTDLTEQAHALGLEVKRTPDGMSFDPGQVKQALVTESATK